MLRVYEAEATTYPSTVSCSSVLLQSLLHKTKPGNSVTVSWHDLYENVTDLTSWRDIRHLYGDSLIIHPPQHEGLLRNAIDNIRYSRTTSITVRVEKRADKIKQEMQSILRHPDVWFHTAASAPLNEMLRLYAVFSVGLQTNLRQRALSRVQQAMRRYYGINRIPSIVLRAKTGILSFTAPVHEALSLLLSSLALPLEVQKHVRSRFRIVNSKRPSIADMLINSRKYAQNYSQELEPMCVHDCSSENHDINQGEDFRGLTRHVLTQNSKNVPYPDFYDSKTELFSGFLQVIPPIERMMCNLETKDELTKAFQEPTPQMRVVRAVLSQAVQKNFQLAPDQALTSSEVRVVRAKLRDWVIVELDKNTGKLSCMCPVRYHRAMTEMYINDTTHYTKQTGITSELLLQQWEWHYDVKNWREIAVFKGGAKMSIPFAHILPKFKDPSRYRVIVSYAHHPLRTVMWVCQKAIMFIISTLPSKHFNLPKTQLFLSRLTQHATELKQQHGNSDQLEFIPFSLDIKEMFTGLPHKTIKQAVDFLLHHAATLNRRNVAHIRVPKDKSDPCGWGKSANLSEVHNITFTQIRGVVHFDVGSAYFSVGDTILLQKAGAPIGGVLSTALAVSTCVYTEIMFVESLGVDSRRLRVIRYVDDITVLIAILRNDPESLIKAQELYQNLKVNCYPKELVLKPENINNGSFKFLETLTTVRGNTIRVRHFSKNTQHIKNNGNQKFYCIQHAQSFSPWNTKYGVAISRLLAITDHCSSRALLIKCVHEFFFELKFLSYSTKFIRRVCQRMFRKTDDAIWLKLASDARQISY